MSTRAIGDIHGCHTALVALLQTVGPSSIDQIVFLGDYIDRGPASGSVIDLLIGISDHWFVIGLNGLWQAVAGGTEAASISRL